MQVTLRSVQRSLLAAAIIVLQARVAAAMERTWTRTTGQFRTEATPLVADTDGDGAQEIIAVNVGGQIMRWSLDGKDAGPGQDGTVAQLSEGQWTSTPAFVANQGDGLLIFGSVEGELVALSAKDHTVRWTYQLKGKTQWSRATPVTLGDDERPLLCIGDQSGTLTAFSLDGKLAWETPLAHGPCQTLVQIFKNHAGTKLILMPSGKTLCCVDTTGIVQWAKELDGDILSRPEVLDFDGHVRILCGAGEGTLYAFDDAGTLDWKSPVGDAIDSSIVILEQTNAAPLILCTGLWGNLYAFDPEGYPQWTALFCAKNRTCPLILDADGNGIRDILVATYDQHVYIFDGTGRRIDELRVNGGINASPVPITDPKTGAADVLVVSTNQLAHRYKPGLPVPIYAAAHEASDVKASWIENSKSPDGSGFIVENPNGALLRINAVTRSEAFPRIAGEFTAQSCVFIPAPKAGPPNSFDVTLEIKSGDGQMLQSPTHLQNSTTAEDARKEVEKNNQEGLTAFAVPAYESFDDTVQSAPADVNSKELSTITVAPLYIGELDQGAFVIASGQHEPTNVLVSLEPPKREDGPVFYGHISLRQAIAVGTLNGERVADALVPINLDAPLTIPAGRAIRIWVCVDGTVASPGTYNGTLHIQPLLGQTTPLNLALRIEVADLSLNSATPLKLCTWDYVPNQWLPANVDKTLDDLAAHGVNVFPRTTIPKARYMGGDLRIDWPALDATLKQIKGRGQLLLQIAEPPIDFPAGLPEDESHQSKVEYVRSLSEHLRDAGWDYADYAFYPVDEPGLDYGPRIPAFLDAAKLFREADPHIRIYTDPVPELSLLDYQRIAPYVDVWCPNMRLVSGTLCDDPRIKDILASGKPVWSYECVSQVRSLSPLCYNRANAWRADYFGLSGIGHWTYSTTTVNPWIVDATKNDEYALVYPGDPPLPSVRWEAVRDGIEDVAAMYMLEDQIHKQKAAGTDADLVAQAENERRIAKNDIMEVSDYAYVESRDFLKQGDRRIWHTSVDAELFITHRKRIAELTLELMHKGGTDRDRSHKP